MCLKEDSNVHDVPCCKCLIKVILTLSSSSSILPTKVMIFERFVGVTHNTMIQVYSFEFVQNLPISVFGNFSFLSLMHVVV
jgi:hypothetical protein